jgi:hypothetical protein
VVCKLSALPEETKQIVRQNLTLLSVLEPVPGMPDPRPHREAVAHLLARLEASGGPGA